MDELIALLRSMRADADQVVQLLTLHHQKTADEVAILERIEAWREELDRLIQRYGDPRDERA